MYLLCFLTSCKCIRNMYIGHLQKAGWLADRGRPKGSRRLVGGESQMSLGAPNICTCICTYMHIYMYMYIYKCMYVYIHRYIT